MHSVDITDNGKYHRVMNLPQSKKSPISIFLFLLGGVLLVYGQSLLDNYLYSRHVGMLVLVAILAIDELYFYFYIFTPHSAISTARSNGVIAQTLAK
jgi:hypothetical protein